MNDELTKQNHPLITPGHLRRLAVVYIRQSTEEQVRENVGSTAFQRSLVGVARSYGWPDSLIQTIDEDLGRSGSASERRTGWQRLQSMIASEQVGVVLVATISRLSRQVYDFELFRMLAAGHNTLLHTDGRLVDPADSSDTIFSQITAMIAQFENHKRTELMSQARFTKAKQGAVVSALPVGWFKTPDGQYDYDPATKDTIKLIIETFWQTRSIRGTVKALIKAAVQIPSRRGQTLYFKKPTIGRVTRILQNPAYAGTYVYGKTQSQPGGSVLASGHSKRIMAPEERWVKTLNHHPAYMSLEEQEEIKSILKKNNFVRRDRAGHGPALSQGLLRCTVCNGSLSVSYHRNNSCSYMCLKSLVYGETPCTRFFSKDFDQYILQEVFKMLETPPIDMLKSALTAARSEKQTRLAWVQAERERLAHEERRAQERADFTQGSHRLVHLDALQRLEKVLEKKARFEQKAAMEPVVTPNEKSEEELDELCRLAGEMPSLWQHATVTNQERKEILRCIIDHVVVAATRESIDATIFWKSGEPTPLFFWRGSGRYNLIRELHAQKLTVTQIKEHLAAGKTSTGQIVNLSRYRVYDILRKLRLKANRSSPGYTSLRVKADELNREGRSVEWIAQHFNEERLATASGKSWTPILVRELLRTTRDKAKSLETIHRNAIEDALGRGLDFGGIALEFNQKKLRRRRGSQAWTARSIRQRWNNLKRLQRHRAQKESENKDPTERVVLKRSA
jgi:DNA invertase Pin-like site-specific DNA recombinase